MVWAPDTRTDSWLIENLRSLLLELVGIGDLLGEGLSRHGLFVTGQKIGKTITDQFVANPIHNFSSNKIKTSPATFDPKSKQYIIAFQSIIICMLLKPMAKVQTENQGPRKYSSMIPKPKILSIESD